MKRSTILILVLFLTACSGGRQSPPSNLDNACAMKSARSGWFKDLRRVERKWGVPDYVYRLANTGMGDERAGTGRADGDSPHAHHTWRRSSPVVIWPSPAISRVGAY